MRNFKQEILEALYGKSIRVIPYGSQVYGTSLDDSDYDFLVIVNRLGEFGITQLDFDDINIQIYNFHDFRVALEMHEIVPIECYSYALENDIFIEDLKFELDLQKLRKSISAKASNSWVKAKKKMTLENEDSYIGIKSLFHSLRILKFGIQIAKYGRVVDFTEARDFWFDIYDSGRKDWDYFFEKYKPMYNSFCTEFRKLAPKEI